MILSILRILRTLSGCSMDARWMPSGLPDDDDDDNHNDDDVMIECIRQSTVH